MIVSRGEQPMIRIISHYTIRNIDLQNEIKTSNVDRCHLGCKWCILNTKYGTEDYKVLIAFIYSDQLIHMFICLHNLN